jgi:hypothetical protein
MTFEALIQRLVQGGFLMTVDDVTDKILVTPRGVPIDDELRHAIREHREPLKLVLLVVETFQGDLGSVRVEPEGPREPPATWPPRPSRRKPAAR